MTQIHDRPFAENADIERITQFLAQTYALNGLYHNWEPRRWQGNNFHRDDEELQAYRTRLPDIVHLWLNDTDNIVGVVIPEYEGGAYLQIHPEYRHIESDMLDWSETHLKQQHDDGTYHFETWASDGDSYRPALLEKRGYQRTEEYDVVRRRAMSLPVPDIELPEGYTLRSMRNHPDDWQAQADLLNAAFNRDFHNAEEYRNFMSSPYYRAELDIVVSAPDGTLATNAGFNLYESASFAVVEPVCTHPDHQKKGWHASPLQKAYADYRIIRWTLPISIHGIATSAQIRPMPEWVLTQ